MSRKQNIKYEYTDSDSKDTCRYNHQRGSSKSSVEINKINPTYPIKYANSTNRSYPLDQVDQIYTTNLINTSNPIKSTITTKQRKSTIDYRNEFVTGIIRELGIDALVDKNNITSEFAITNSRKKKIKNINEVMNNAGYDMIYIKSGSTGHTFKAQSRTNPDYKFAIKVCGYCKDEYGPKNDPGRPENVEVSVFALLSNLMLSKATPHLVMPLGTFHTAIQHFTDPSIIDGYNPKLKRYEMYTKFLKRYNKNRFDKFVSVLIVEWCNGGDLLDYIKCNHKTMTTRIWKIIFLQILLTLAKIHERYPTFRHNDLKANNILVQLSEDFDKNTKGSYKYEFDKYFFVVPNIGISVKLWDFDFASINGKIENNKVNSDWTHEMNITNETNQYYDMHYLFNSLMSNRFLPNFQKIVPIEILEFIDRIIPQIYRTPIEGGETPYVNERGRIQVNEEYTTPYQTITSDILFDKYRYLNAGKKSNY